eukprot:scaffold16330_cov171-Skeletonema_menzelii.AAC.6
MKRFSRKQEFLGNKIYKDGDDDKTSPSNKADKLKQQLKSVKKSKAFGFIDWLNRRKTRKMKRTGERGGEETMTSTNVSYVRVRNDGAMAIMDCTAGGNAAVHRFTTFGGEEGCEYSAEVLLVVSKMKLILTTFSVAVRLFVSTIHLLLWLQASVPGVAILRGTLISSKKRIYACHEYKWIGSVQSFL